MVNWSMRRQRDRRVVFCAACRYLHSYVNILIEAGKDCHQAVNGEAIQIGAADAGEVGGSNAGDRPETVSLVTRLEECARVSCTLVPAMAFLIASAIRSSASLIFFKAVSRASSTGR